MCCSPVSHPHALHSVAPFWWLQRKSSAAASKMANSMQTILYGSQNHAVSACATLGQCCVTRSSVRTWETVPIPSFNPESAVPSALLKPASLSVRSLLIFLLIIPVPLAVCSEFCNYGNSLTYQTTAYSSWSCDLVQNSKQHSKGKKATLLSFTFAVYV